MNLLDYIIVGLLVLWGVGAIVHNRRRPGGKDGSCDSCSGCPYAGKCSKKVEED